MAEKLDKSPSTISREVQRQKSTQYIATIAANRYRQQRKRCHKEKKLISGTPLFDKVHNMLRYRQWSPEQISNRLKLDYPSDPTMQVSHECIYASIYAFPKNELKKVFISELRQHKAKRGAKRKSNCASVKVLPEQQIDQRPKEVEDRQIAGHWEGDLIVGAMNRSCVGTLVERTTGYVVLCKMDSKSAPDVRASFERQMKKIDYFFAYQ